MDFRKLDETRKSLSEKIDEIEKNFQASINKVTEFLDEHNSIDYAEMRQQVMQKVYKEELIAEQQQQQQCKTNQENHMKKIDENVFIKAN